MGLAVSFPLIGFFSYIFIFIIRNQCLFVTLNSIKPHFKENLIDY